MSRVPRCQKKASQKAYAPEYPCTECGGDAFIGYSAGRNKTGWDGLVEQGERLCTRCFQKRGGKNLFAKG